MIFTTEEQHLFNSFQSSSFKTTILVVLEALSDITDPDVYVAAVSVLKKLGNMGDDEYNSLVFEREECYV